MPNIRPFCMPKWGIEMTEGTLAEWKVAEGATIKPGETICLIETDKITNDVDAEYTAVVKKILVPAGGAPVPVGTLLAVMADASDSDADVATFIAGFKPAETSVAAKSAQTAAPVAQPVAQTIQTNKPISPEALKLAQQLGVDLSGVEGSGRGGRITFQDVQQASKPVTLPKLKGTADISAALENIFASPLAKRLAALHGVDLAALKGTGPRGRISKVDVLAAMPKSTFGAPAAFTAPDNQPTIKQMDKVRKVVARRLTESKQHIPHFYLRMTVAVDALLTLRKTANLVLGSKASINDYLVRAVALSLARHRDVNIQVHGDAIHHFAHADIAIAVASPAGLVTPIVRGADLMRVDQIAAATRALIDKAQAGKLDYRDLEGGTFSISNLGMFGIDQFDAIINPPQGAILAVGGITRQLTENEDGNLVMESRMALSLSCDHRAIDGAAGATFMATLRGLIEDPEQLFA
jgi:pyruvate dehydrogenase E2 component (dihydrolipoamide acetyltransferase)